MKLLKKLNAAEVVTLVYIVITTGMVIYYWDGLADPMAMIGLRIAAIAVMIATIAISRLIPVRWIGDMLRILPWIVMMIWWYPENYDFCSQLPYKDHLFAQMDQDLFGCQPSMEFSKLLPQKMWSELICMGYYSYYLVMAAILIFFVVLRKAELNKAAFVFYTSFFLFYFIYQFLPVAGPCFYFNIPGALHGFPDVGYYFKEHTEMMPLGMDGFFASLVQSAHDIGERPTAAFPSSHVGMGTISMLLAIKSRNKYLVCGLLPFYILLCMGTVYIRAHYLVDSIAGFFTAIVFFFLTSALYNLLKYNRL